MNNEEQKKLDALVHRALQRKPKPEKVTDRELGFTLDEFAEKVLMPRAQQVGRLMRFDELIARHEERMKKETPND